MFNLRKKNGIVVFYVLILILVVMLGIGVGIFVLTRGEQKILRNITKSTQAYYTAEAGIEDALLRLVKNMNSSNLYSLNVANSTATIEVSDIIGGSRTITSEGNVIDRIRKIQIVYQINSEEVSFYYGAQIGDGGIEMGNNAEVNGNVFSNGNVVAGVNAEITGTAKVAQTGNYIDGGIIGEDAFVDICKNSTIGDALTCASSTNCTAASIETLTEEIATSSLPVSEEQITKWKSDALSGGTTSDYILDGKVTDYLGPKKITGNMTLDNKATLIMTGTIWVMGDITVKNGAGIRLDPSSYAGQGGILVADGKINIRPGVALEGSGEEGSYLLLVSTNASLDKLAPAINIDNTTIGGIFYTPNSYDGRNGGLIVIKNNVSTRQVTGYKVYLEENAVITYEYGLQDAEFSSGPGGSWKVSSWKEIE